jgi:hypothetical protein
MAYRAPSCIFYHLSDGQSNSQSSENFLHGKKRQNTHWLSPYSEFRSRDGVRYREGSKKHLDDPVPNGDFPVLCRLGIGSSVSGIGFDSIGKYMFKL